MDKIRNKNGITLIALIITIIVMLILVAVTINMAVNGGLFGYASNATKETKKAIADEQNLGDYIEDLLDGPNGAYVGNIKMASEILIPELDEHGNEYYFNSKIKRIDADELSLNEEKLSSFFRWCYNENDPELQGVTIPSFNDALEIAGMLGVNKSIVKFAYNNRDARVRNVLSPILTIEPTSLNSGNCFFELYMDITSEERNFDFSMNIYTHFVARIEDDTEDPQVVFGDTTMNPECISIYWLDENGPFDDVELPFGMVMKYKENPFSPSDFEDEYYESNGDLNDWESNTIIHYNDKDSYCEAYAEMYNSDKGSKWVIEWQGQEFNWQQLRKFILQNYKIQTNNYEWNFSDSRGIYSFFYDSLNINNVNTLSAYFEKMFRYYNSQF